MLIIKKNIASQFKLFTFANHSVIPNNLIMRSIFFPLALTLSLLTCCSPTSKNFEDISSFERDSAMASICSLVANGMYENAIVELDSMELEYAEDPQIPFTHGVALYVSGDSCSARKYFTQSIHKYDAKLKRDNNIFDAINRTFCILFTEGDEAYHQQLETLKSTYHRYDEMERIDFFMEIRLDEVIPAIIEDWKYGTIKRR